MSASRPLVGLLLAIAFGLAAYAIAQRLARYRSPASAAVQGFGGWLLVLAIGQWLAAMHLLSEILRRLPLYERAWQMPESRAEALGEIAARVALLAFVLCAAIMMTRRSRLYPRLLRLELVLLVVLPALSG